jgi:hypothetical protein
VTDKETAEKIAQAIAKADSITIMEMTDVIEPFLTDARTELARKMVESVKANHIDMDGVVSKLIAVAKAEGVEL